LTNEQFWAIDEAVKRDEAWENRKEAVQDIVSRIIIPIVCATQLETENPSTNTHIRVCSTCGKRVYYDNGNCTYPCSCANGWIWVPKAPEGTPTIPEKPETDEEFVKRLWERVVIENGGYLGLGVLIYVGENIIGESSYMKFYAPTLDKAYAYAAQFTCERLRGIAEVNEELQRRVRNTAPLSERKPLEERINYLKAGMKEDAVRKAMQP